MTSTATGKRLGEAARQQITARLASNPGVILEQLAATHECSMIEIIECLPADMWQRLPGDNFVPLLQEIHGWQTPVTLLVHSADAILEFTGPLPPGSVGHGFYNLENASGLHGHLRYQHCAAIYLVERPFMNKPTVSLLFCNTTGQVMFKIFVGRGEAGELLEQQHQALLDFVEAHCCKVCA